MVVAALPVMQIRRCEGRIIPEDEDVFGITVRCGAVVERAGLHVLAIDDDDLVVVDRIGSDGMRRDAGGFIKSTKG